MKPENVKCPDCNGEMAPRESKFGKFWGCKKYPECKGTRDSMGRSKAERELERSDNKYSDDHEDIGPDSHSITRRFIENDSVSVTFNKDKKRG